VIDWGEGLPAPEAVMEMLSCTCSRECLQDTCTCMQNKINCTYLCKLATCTNQIPKDEEEEVRVSDNDEGEEEDYSMIEFKLILLVILVYSPLRDYSILY